MEDILQEEEAFLRRCKRFVLGHPGAPGGGLKDVLYLTPCDRWLRLCSGYLVNNHKDYVDDEFAMLPNCVAVAALFDEYYGFRPPDLVRTLRDELNSLPPRLVGEFPLSEHQIPRNSLLAW